MDSSSSDRTHRPRTTTTTNTSSELFIGFTSRHSSSSSMKFSSKPSILSPARARDPSISLSTSRSRRLRTSRSIKNGQASPMFPAEGRKRGSGFENPEPSSPKVTCIGQVRVKTKKKGKKIQTLTRRRSAEVSFRITEHARHDQIRRQSSVNSQYQQHQEFSSHRNQKWVHLPSTICETLKGFGSEFSCLFPCKPSCFSERSEREKGEEKVGGEGEGNDGGQSPCGALFGRWLVAVQDDGEGGKGRDTEVVVGGADEEEGERPIRSARRHVFDEIEIKDDIFEVKDHEGNDMEGGEGRVSICIPPKNALLLMRCRSDPVKMEALANRFWEPQLPKQEEEDEEAERDNDVYNNRNKEEAVSVEMVQLKDEVAMVQKENLKQVSEEGRKLVSVDINEEEDEEENQPEAEESLEMEVQEKEEDKPIEDLQNNEAPQDGDQEETEKETLIEEENELGFATLFEALADEESEEDDENDPMKYKNEDESRVSYSNATFSLQSDQEISEPEEEEEEELTEEVALELEYSMESTVEKETQDKTLEVKLVEKLTQEEEEEEGSTRKTEERETESNAVVERESEAELKKKKERESSSRLPDSLLLMMCEPKLSMEVSKEIWVCGTDFIRWKPPVLVKQTDGGDDHADDDEPAEKMVSVDSNSLKSYYQPLLQPPRSSCCLPAMAGAVTMATMIEQKVVSAVAYEPFVLTRCKSAPMRTASKKLAPDVCFRATFGIGAAEVGF